VPTFVVSPDPSEGEYSNITGAIAALPDDGTEYAIFIESGTYEEQIVISRKGKLSIHGETSFQNDSTRNRVTILYSSKASTGSEEDEDAPVIDIEADGTTSVALYNLNFRNTFPQATGTAALAADISGSVAAYGCSFIGYQNTLLANQGLQVFSNCYIEGSIDFVWGYSTAYFHQSYIATNTAGGSIVAQGRPSKTSGGYVFDTCVVTYTSSYGTKYQDTYLGRPLSEYSLVIYRSSYLDKHINPAGWTVWSKASPRTDHVTFAEYKNSGPGSWNSKRAAFATQLTEEEAEAYTLSSWIGDTSWIDMATYNLMPSYDLPNPTESDTAIPTESSSPAPSLGHPETGKTPPPGAISVSVSGSVSDTFESLTDALASLPEDDSTQVIFMYAGSYEEQVPSINRDGPVVIIGYTDGNPGQSFADNTVTITFSRGTSTSPLPTGHTESETATISTKSDRIAIYNINIVNKKNSESQDSPYATLAASLFGTHIAFYGCSFVAWQDTLFTGSPDGYQYFESTYIEGAIDPIWGYSKAYFKGCTIGAKIQDAALTAQGRSPSAIGGYIFDQCYFGAASGIDVNLTQSIYLGRPYSENALVVIKNSHLTNVVSPSGWKAWSDTDPRTKDVKFAEYNNIGAGNWENNRDAREALGFCELLETDDYGLESVMDTTDWIDLTYWDSISVPGPSPSEPESGSGPGTQTGTSPGSSTATSSASGTDQYDGTKPPSGAYVVSKTSIENISTYRTIQDAIDAISVSSEKKVTVFIYPGTYDEQIEVTTPGTVVLMGYSENTGDYSANNVTILHNEGSDTPDEESATTGATFYAAGGYLQAININFVNTANPGKNIASVAFAVKDSKHASLYSCKVVGNRGALLINGYLFAADSYIEGNSDMIWGKGAGYFLASTISPNQDGVSLTADKRSTESSKAGFVFDQCIITPATSTGSLSEISLGRPLNRYARVVYVYSSLSSCVEAVGWEQWSSSSPRTSDVLFGEYKNHGGGSDTSERASFAVQLDDEAAKDFELANFFPDVGWIDFNHVDASPFEAGQPAPGAAEGAGPTSTTAGATAADETKTITQSSTVVTTVTITKHEVTSTKTSAITVDLVSTVTPALITENDTYEATTTILATVTGDQSTTTATTTTSTTSTFTAPPSTITSDKVITTTSIETLEPETKIITSTLVVDIGDGGTKTELADAITTTSTVTLTKTTTKNYITTLSCIPDDFRLTARELAIPRSDKASSTITADSTMTEAIRSSPTSLVSTRHAAALNETSAFAKTVTVTSLITQTSSTTAAQATSYTTITHTTSVGKTKVLNTSTLTKTVTKLATKTFDVTLTVPMVTITSFKTITIRSTSQAPPYTTTVTKVSTVRSSLALPPQTSVSVKATISRKTPSVTITVHPTSTSTAFVQSTSTATRTVTKFEKGASLCSN
jgi:pectin methylesterase-like acyl-CoA thioesterase